VTLVVGAPAKVNLSLRVLGRRNDGFHEIRTLFQAVDLADEVRVSPSGSGISVQVVGADVGPERENLAYRAADAFLTRFGGLPGVVVRLTKRIPAGAGLGGGSSDAAAVLRALGRLVATPPDPEAVAEIGAMLGSDVPFFLGASPLARAGGRGERLIPLPPLPEAHMVLALPPVHVGTADAYRALGRGLWAELEAPTAPGGPHHWTEVDAGLVNDFQAPVADRHSEVRASLDALRAAGASGVLLSGSGAASFGLFGGAEQAARVARELTGRLGWPCLAVRTLRSWPEPRLIVPLEP